VRDFLPEARRSKRGVWVRGKRIKKGMLRTKITAGKIMVNLP